MPAKSLLEVQFPIAQLSLESYIERKAGASQFLNSLGKWWGTKPLVMTRAIIIGALFEASDEPERWPEDLDVFLKLMSFDNAGMWKRKVKAIQPTVCYAHARPDEKVLFADPESWAKRMSAADREHRRLLEKRVFYTLGHTAQRPYCCRAEESDGPPPESWKEINTYCGTHASILPDWVAEMSERRFGRRLRVGDAFSGMGSIPFEAAELGCDVYASDLNPVACLLTWSALRVLGAHAKLHARLAAEQQRIYREMDGWYLKSGVEASEEGWRAAFHLYCMEIPVPEWGGWLVPLSPSWQVDTLHRAWIELVPDERHKRFSFKIRFDKEGYEAAEKGTKQGADVVCPQALWEILHRKGKTSNATRTIKLNTLIENHGGLRKWEKSDIVPREGDFYGERLYCIRWIKPPAFDALGNELEPQHLIYREPTDHDLRIEKALVGWVQKHLAEWQGDGWIPDWRIQAGAETTRLGRERGWTHWHHLFAPRQLLMISEFSRRIAQCERDIRVALLLGVGKLLDRNCRLCPWLASDSGAIAGSKNTFYNQAFNTMFICPIRGWVQVEPQVCVEHRSVGPFSGTCNTRVGDARFTEEKCDLWITDPPYADAVNYEELSEFFLAWYKPHLKACFPDWYADSKRDHAVKGDDAPFRIAMAECYTRLAERMPDDGLQVLMFTHKDTDVWEDLALIMWSAGLQVKQVWSIATETPGAGIRVGNYVQATYNMVLRKRPKTAPMGFAEMVIPQINSRVKEVITHMRESQVQAGNLSCGYTDTDYLLAAQAVAAEVVTGFSSIDGIDLDEELRTLNKERRQRGASVLRDMMNQAKRTAVDFLVPLGLEEHLKRSPDGTSAYQFWRALASEEKFLLKALELEAGGVEKIGAFQDLGRAYGIADYGALLGPVKANEARTKLPDEFPRPDVTRWDDIPANEREQFAHSITRHIYQALHLLGDGAEADRAVKHLVDCTNFWQDRQGKHLVILGYLYQITEPIAPWADIRPLIQTLRLAVENHRA
jgi:adenine-specific DNA methylase